MRPTIKVRRDIANIVSFVKDFVDQDANSANPRASTGCPEGKKVRRWEVENGK
jgi:hypothetical protein